MSERFIKCVPYDNEYHHVSSVATTEAQHQVQRGLLLDVVVGESAAVLELLAREDKALLVRGDALLILDLALDHVDGVGALRRAGAAPSAAWTPSGCCSRRECGPH